MALEKKVTTKQEMTYQETSCRRHEGKKGKTQAHGTREKGHRNASKRIHNKIYALW